MKKILIYLLLLLPVAVMAQVPFTITGKLQHAGNDAMIYFNYQMGQGKEFADSARLQNGQFTFSGTVPEIKLGRLTIAHKAENVRTLKGPDFIVVLLDGKIDINNSDSLIHATIKGNQVVNDFVAIQKSKTEQQDKVAKMWFSYLATPKALRDDNAFGELYGKASNDAKTNSRNLDFAYIKTHPSSYLSTMFLLDHATSEPVDTIDNAFKSITPSLKKREAGKIVAQILEKRKSILVGGHAPDFTVSDTSGTPVKLSAYRGKYVLVDFWASWCKPCRAESPYLVKAYAKYSGKNFTIVSVSIDRKEDQEKWHQAIRADHTGGWTQLGDGLANQSPLNSLYHLDSIPQNVLIDPNGVIIAKNLRGEDVQQKLSELFPN